MMAAPLRIGMPATTLWIGMLATLLWIGMLATPLWIGMLATPPLDRHASWLFLYRYASYAPSGLVC
jgi:hypothetical protein